jgi:hypothetical protein
MCSVCKRVRGVLHPTDGNQAVANILLCNMLLTEIEVEQKLRHSDVMVSRKNYFGYAMNGKHHG